MNHFFINSVTEFNQSIEIVSSILGDSLCLDDCRKLVSDNTAFEPYSAVVADWSEHGECIRLPWLVDAINEALESPLTDEQTERLRQDFMDNFTYSRDTAYIHRLELQIVRTSNSGCSIQVSCLDFKTHLSNTEQETIDGLIESAPLLDTWLSLTNIVSQVSSNVPLVPRSQLEMDFGAETIREVFGNKPLISTYSTLSGYEDDHHLGLGFATVYIKSNTDATIDLSGEPQFVKYCHGEYEITARIVAHDTEWFPILDSDGNEDDVTELFDRHCSDIEPFSSPIDEDEAVSRIIDDQYNCLTTVIDDDSILDIYDLHFSIHIDNEAKQVSLIVSEPCRSLGHFEFSYAEKLGVYPFSVIQRFKDSGSYEGYTYKIEYEIEALTLNLNDDNTCVIFHEITDVLADEINDELSQVTEKWSHQQLANFLKGQGVFACNSAEQISGYDGDLWTNSHALYDQSGQLLFVIETVSAQGYCQQYTDLMGAFNTTFAGGRHIGRVREFDISWCHSVDTFTTYIEPEAFTSQTVANHLIMLVIIDNPSPQSLFSIDEVDQSVLSHLVHYSRQEPKPLHLAGPTPIPIKMYSLIQDSIEALGIKSTADVEKINQLARHVRNLVWKEHTPDTDNILLCLPILTDFGQTELTDFVVEMNMARGVFGERKPISELVPPSVLKDFANSLGGGEITDIAILHPEFIEESPLYYS